MDNEHHHPQVPAAGPDDRMARSSTTNTRWALAAAVILLLIVAYWLRQVLIPFFAAAAIAYVATPAVHWIAARLRSPRWVAALLVYLVCLAVLAGIALGVRYTLIPQAIEMAGNARGTLHEILVRLFRGEHAHAFGQDLSATELSDRMMAAAGQLLRSPADLIQAGTITFEFVMGVFLVVVLLGYFLLDGPRLSRGLLWLIPPRLRPRAQSLGRQSHPVLFSYIRGILVIVAYATLITWIAARFVLHLPQPLILSIAVGLLELIPAFGPILSICLLVFAAIQNISLTGIIGLAIFLTVLRLSIDQLIGPLILGRATELPPPVIIFAFLAGGTLFGLLGVVLAIPVAAIIKIVLTNLYEPHLIDESDQGIG